MTLPTSWLVSCASSDWNSPRQNSSSPGATTAAIVTAAARETRSLVVGSVWRANGGHRPAIHTKARVAAHIAQPRPIPSIPVMNGCRPETPRTTRGPAPHSR